MQEDVDEVERAGEHRRPCRNMLVARSSCHGRRRATHGMCMIYGVQCFEFNMERILHYQSFFSRI